MYSIDAGLPFARDLAVGVKKLAATPERLARGLILLPSRRAARALQEAFLDVSSGQPMLLPRMLPIGELGGDDGLADAIGGLGVDAGLPPAISALRRQVILAKLLRHFPLGGVRPSHPQA
ncbi:MAG: double-strand break repair protein AddB, partial [Candidatus Puniceispirillum sp.]